MQQKIQQALADSPLSNAILSALEELEWKGFLPAEKVWSHTHFRISCRSDCDW